MLSAEVGFLKLVQPGLLPHLKQLQENESFRSRQSLFSFSDSLWKCSENRWSPVVERYNVLQFNGVKLRLGALEKQIKWVPIACPECPMRHFSDLNHMVPSNFSKLQLNLYRLIFSAVVECQR